MESGPTKRPIENYFLILMSDRADHPWFTSATAHTSVRATVAAGVLFEASSEHTVSTELSPCNYMNDVLT